MWIFWLRTEVSRQNIGTVSAFNGAYFDVPQRGFGELQWPFAWLESTCHWLRYRYLAECQSVVISKALTLEALESQLVAQGRTLTTGDKYRMFASSNYNSGDDISWQASSVAPLWMQPVNSLTGPWMKYWWKAIRNRM